MRVADSNPGLSDSEAVRLPPHWARMESSTWKCLWNWSCRGSWLPVLIPCTPPAPTSHIPDPKSLLILGERELLWSCLSAALRTLPGPLTSHVSREAAGKDLGCKDVGFPNHG